MNALDDTLKLCCLDQHVQCDDVRGKMRLQLGPGKGRAERPRSDQPPLAQLASTALNNSLTCNDSLLTTDALQYRLCRSDGKAQPVATDISHGTCRGVSLVSWAQAPTSHHIPLTHDLADATECLSSTVSKHGAHDN